MFYKKIFIILLVLSFFAIAPVSAQLNLGSTEAMNAANQAGYNAVGTTETTLAENIGFVIKTALSFVGVIFLCLSIYAGFLWMTAGGEEEAVKKAQTILKQAVIGLIIVVSAYSITSFVVPMLVEKAATGTSVVPGSE